MRRPRSRPYRLIRALPGVLASERASHPVRRATFRQALVGDSFYSAVIRLRYRGARVRVKKLLLILLALVPALVAPAVADASSSIRYGVQDDAWLASGPGTVSERVERLQRLGVQIVRFTVRWDQVARRAPASPASPADDAYDWTIPDHVLKNLHEAGIEPVVTLYG